MNQDASGAYRIYEGRTVQARVIAVAEKAVRIEAFGVECSIMARDLSWDWIGDANDRFSVGDQILVRILEVNRDSLEELSIRADVKSVSENTNRTYLKQCRVQSKYAGKVTIKIAFSWIFPFRKAPQAVRCPSERSLPQQASPVYEL